MKKSTYTTYDELPLFLNADLVAQVLGISISSAYELMHEKDFTSMRIGNRLIVPKEKFKIWVDEKIGKLKNASRSTIVSIQKLHRCKQ